MTHPRVKTCFLFLAVLLFGVFPLHAQLTQDDVAVSALGAFPSSTKGIYTEQDPANQLGFLVEFRHIWNPLFGYEITYSLNRANQGYTDIGPNANSCPPAGCSFPTHQLVRAYAHEISADWVVSLPLAKWRPFALAGGGVQIFEPAGGQTNTQSDAKASLVYGAGLDWLALRHFGLRFQFRGNLYKAPDMNMLFPPTDKLVHSAKPMLGIFYRF